MSNNIVLVCIVLILYLCIPVHSLHRHHKHNSTKHNDLGPIIGRDDHDYRPHIQPLNNPTNNNKQQQQQVTATDIVPDQNITSKQSFITPLNNANTTSKLNKYDQQIADVGKTNTNTKSTRQQQQSTSSNNNINSNNNNNQNLGQDIASVSKKSNQKDYSKEEIAEAKQAAKEQKDIQKQVIQNAKLQQSNKQTDLDKTNQDKQDDNLRSTRPQQDNNLGKTQHNFPANGNTKQQTTNDNVQPIQTQTHTLPPAPAPTQPYKMNIHVKDYTIYVDDNPFYVKGMYTDMYQTLHQFCCIL